MSKELPKTFEPHTFEQEIYEFWEKNGCFKASDENAPGQKSFCIMIPPPNVTGVLHIGHALTNTIQDALTRWRRMCGDNTLWLPGTDHAGISTQVQVEKAIAKEGKGPSGKPLTRHDLGREAFLKRTWKWKEDHESIIRGQLKRLGTSLDWDRERFTMDEGCSRAVLEVFVRLYKEGLIYRGERIINWCPISQTALSDLEVIPTERKGHLWHIRYGIYESDGTPVKNKDGTPASVVIATTRPETLLGDTAIAVHPEDERYTHIHGKMAKLPILGRMIPVITDSYVDREFGTGALKVTPAHDFNDYGIGKRHNLPMVSVMGKDGKMTAAAGPVAGLKFSEARERVVLLLKDSGELIKTEDHVHKVGLSERTGQPAEPVISKQWFVKIEPLAKKAIDVVESGKITFTPKSWEKTYFEWMYNIRDWCISRQLWWGHQIPAWYCGHCQHINVALDEPKKCEGCGAPVSELKRDDDVLDTWFSSALWPFATLGWPEKTPALKTFYPNSILETGFDIIFFWVARMIMMGTHFMGDVPFKKVYIHALVRDEKGEKMSKSKGNVIDPLELMSHHGADPLRFTLAIMSGQGRDIKLSTDRVEGYQAFCNKLWNAVKFFHLQMESEGPKIKEPKNGAESWLLDQRLNLLPVNRWILSELQKVAKTVEQGLENFELNVSTQALYDYTWFEFCDWYLEFSKIYIKESSENREQTIITLHYVLETLLRLLHPFIPFATEALWRSLPWKKSANTPARMRDKKPALETIMFQTWPKPVDGLVHAESEKSIQTLKNVIEAIRNFKGENRISPKEKFAVRYHSSSSAADSFIRMYKNEILALARISDLERVSGAEGKSDLDAVIPLTNPPMELRINLKGLVDVGEETKRLSKEIDKVQADLQKIRTKLSQEKFVAHAPQEVVDKERGREKELASKLGELEKALQRLEKHHASV